MDDDEASDLRADGYAAGVKAERARVIRELLGLLGEVRVYRLPGSKTEVEAINRVDFETAKERIVRGEG